jgi:hypothetical protein
VQAAAPDNHSQVVAVYRDSGPTNLTLSVRLLYNTFIGNGGSAALVHLSNADGTRMNAEMSDNIIYGTTRPFLVENTNVGSVVGVNNWLQTNATAGTLSGSVKSATPGFRNAAAQDYTLAPGSVCIGAASAAVYGLPGREYYRNELTNRLWRVRAAARDLGAFESTTTNNPVGPYDPAPLPRLTLGRSGSSGVIGWPLFAADFQLQQSDLRSPVTWNAAGSASSTSATEVSLTVPVGIDRAFYRLRQ